MATLKSRAGAAKLGAPLMVLSFLMVAGFIYWLSVTAEPTEVVAPEPETTLENVVAIEAFSAGPDGYVGQIVSFEDVAVTGRNGNHAFFITLADANSNGYLLHLSDSLAADTMVTVATGMTLTVTGTVVATNDSVLDAWEAAGAFTNQAERLMAQSTYYLNFLEVTLIEWPESDADEPGEGDESGSDEGNES